MNDRADNQTHFAALDRPGLCLVALGLVASLAMFFGACGGQPSDQAIPETEPAVSNDAGGAQNDLESQWAQWNDPERQEVDAFRIFDNLSFVGLEWVSCYVIETSEGLILIDTLYGDFVEHAVDGIRQLGLDPEDIEIVLATHGHFDHNGGIKFFKDTYGAQIGMTAADWTLTESEPSDPRFAVPQIERDLVIEDGQEITLGDTTITAYATPGHTEGVLSLDFDVRDGDQTYRAFTFGGVGLNFSGIDRTEAYLASVARIRALSTTGEQPISVNVANHPGVGKLFERRDRASNRAEGAPHPFVDPEGYATWLDDLESAARQKLVQEMATIDTEA